MKKAFMERNIRKLKNQIPQIAEITRHTKVSSLWEHEASLRKKIKEIKKYDKYREENKQEYDMVLNSYIDILKDVSIRIIDDYNNKNGTKFDFNKIINNYYGAFLQSGIINILITDLIPEMVSKEFDIVFPKNSKNEYNDARKIKRKFYLHLGDTNTGKTYNAMQKLKAARKGIYLSPLRILALENYERMNKDGVKCNLITGEEEIIIEDASHISCTIEKLNVDNDYEVAVIDEIQMINDDQRGAAWTRALLGLKSKEIHICGAVNAKELLIKILEDCNDEYEIIEYKRDIPLIVENKYFHYNDIQPGDALVVFSKKRVLELTSYYSQKGTKASLIYGDLPPEVRRKQYEQFINKENSILISTDAIGMGVNLPIKRIVFMDIKKFDGNEIRFLNSQEIKQIAGRAGRKGIYEEGYVSSYGDNNYFITENLESEDFDIETAVLGPSEEILKVKSLSLREKLALWASKEEQDTLYRKMDITEYLIVLDKIKSYKLDERIQWRLLKIPFDVSSEEMLDTFLRFLDEYFIAKNEAISKPQCLSKELNSYEIYYQKINLYYSFSKAFSLEFDKQWVYDERINVSEKINRLLMRI
ncbi:MAG: DEAD/DEAH box helicase [Bacillota bacterium]|nr:DEAD/DEAH box helicase [Bacillota bacterium]